MTKRRFLDEAPASWKTYRNVDSLSGTWSERRVDRATGQQIRRREVEYKIAGPWAVAIDRDEPAGSGQAEQTVWGINSRYAFRLVRTADGSPWLIENLRTGADLQAADARRAHGLARSGQWSGLRLAQGGALDTLIQEKVLVVQDAVPVRRDGADLVEVHVKYRPPKPKAGERPSQDPIRSGTYWLDPGNHWLIREAEVQAEWGRSQQGTMTARFEYGGRVGDHPAVKRRNVVHSARVEGSPAAPTEIEFLFEHEVGPLEDRSERQFQLSAFGLPEPFEDRPDRTWLWFLAGGTLLVVIALALRWKRHKSP